MSPLEFFYMPKTFSSLRHISRKLRPVTFSEYLIKIASEPSIKGATLNRGTCSFSKFPRNFHLLGYLESALHCFNTPLHRIPSHFMQQRIMPSILFQWFCGCSNYLLIFKEHVQSL